MSWERVTSLRSSLISIGIVLVHIGFQEGLCGCMVASYGCWRNAVYGWICSQARQSPRCALMARSMTGPDSDGLERLYAGEELHAEGWPDAVFPVEAVRCSWAGKSVMHQRRPRLDDSGAAGTAPRVADSAEGA